MKKYILILFSLLILTAAACNSAGSGGGETANGVPTLAPTAVPLEEVNPAQESNPEPADEEPVTVVEEASGGETAVEPEVVDAGEPEEGNAGDAAGAELISLDNVLLYDEPPNMNYLTTLEFAMTATNEDGSTSQVGRVTAEGARTITPDASSMLFTMEGGAGGGLGDTMNIVQIENTFYASMPPNNCMTLAGESGFENPFALFLDTGGFLANDVQRVLPNQTINGVDSRHYVLDEENIVSLAVYEVYDADLYVAESGGYVTRLLITGYGANEVVSGGPGQAGDIYYELNFIPTDNVPPITPPAGCGQTDEAAAEYPTLPDAANVTSAEGFYMYETQTPFEEVVQFYKTEMTQNNEWTLAQEIVQAPNATLTFTGAGGTLIVSIGPGPSGGTQVGIGNISSP